MGCDHWHDLVDRAFDVGCGGFAFADVPKMEVAEVRLPASSAECTFEVAKVYKLYELAYEGRRVLKYDKSTSQTLIYLRSTEYTATMPRPALFVVGAEV